MELDTSGVDPKGTLQTYPTIIGVSGTRDRDLDLAQTVAKLDIGGHDPNTPPVGEALGLIVSTPVGWDDGDVVEVGPFRVAAQRNREYLISFVSPQAWLDARTLDIRVHRFGSKVKLPFLTAGPDAVKFRSEGPRTTRWSAEKAVASTALGDHRRALQLRMDGSDLVMDWFHTRSADVFCELKDHRRRMMRVVLVEGGTALTDGTADWYAARPTRFPL